MNLRKVVYLVALLLMLFSACYSGIKIETVPVNLINSQLKLLATNYNAAKATSTNKDIVTVRSLNNDGSLNLIPSKDWCSGFYPALCGLDRF